jgi:hypothetical protein
MTHLTHDELVLLHYDEEIPVTARVHLLSCTACRRESELLKRVLHQVDRAGEPPELPATWEDDLWTKLQWKLDRRVRRRYGWMAAAAAMLAVAFFAGRAIERAQRPLPAAAAAPQAGTTIATAVTAAIRQRVLLAVVGEHMGRSERVLTEVKNASADQPATAIGDRQALEDLGQKNRLYLEAAHASGDESLASILEELQPMLLELARAPEQPSAEDVAALQKRIDRRGALLKLRVARESLRHQQSL